MSNDEYRELSQKPQPEQSPSFDYRSKLLKLLEEHGTSFLDFTSEHQDLLQLGRQVISSHEATGFNFIKSIEHLPLDSEQPLIFYSRYISEVEHLVEVLETMEKRSLISSVQIRFGAKASTVINEGFWEPDKTSEPLLLQSEEHTEINCDQTVEAVVIISPNSPENALEITNFLYDETPNMPNGWQTPDIRATRVLETMIDGTKFSRIQANILKKNDGSALLIARKYTTFNNPWKTNEALMNSELAEFISSDTVSP